MNKMSHKPRTLCQSDIRPAQEKVAALAGPTMEQVASAVLKTVLYSDLFDYPLTAQEVTHYLIDCPGTESQVLAVLHDPAWLDGLVKRVDGFVTLPGRENTVARRRQRSLVSRRSWRKARFYARILGHLPFVRMVAITGALAMDNGSERDDVDILLVTAPGRVWLARALAVLLVYAGRVSPYTLCPNYVISEEVLALEPRTVYVAHEFAQMVPLYGFEVYGKLRAANPWVREVLPNATAPLHHEPEFLPGRLGKYVKTFTEWLLSGRIGDLLDVWEMKRKIRKFAPRTAQASESVIFDRNQVKGHFDDHGARISLEYQRRLHEFRLSTPVGTLGTPPAAVPE